MFAPHIWLIVGTILTLVQNSESTEFSFKNKLYHVLSNQTFRAPNKGINASLFGYSVAYQEKMKSLIVGSPIGNELGRAFACETIGAGTCSRLPVDAALKTKAAGHNFWLGARVDAGKDFYMVCAPRQATASSEPNGLCHYKKYNEPSGINLRPMSQVSSKSMTEYYAIAHPNLKPQPSREYVDFTSFGWSSHVSYNEYDEQRILVGGPAMSIGRTIVYMGPGDSPYLIMVNNTDLKNYEKDISHNFGYSITSGKYEPERDETMYAISSPYGTIGKGRVVILANIDGKDVTIQGSLIDRYFIDDSEVGALFGAALSTMKCGSSADALLVGAPTSIAGAGAGAFDRGAAYVYVFIEHPGSGYKPKCMRKIAGYKNGGYFGAAIVSVGDLNGDEIDEIAISAPYENNGQGAVYIYSGSQLLNQTLPDPVPWLQRIAPEAPTEQYFGLALNALNDDDENGCKELAIGAPGDNYVMLLRCMATVKAHFDVKFPDLQEQSRDLATSDSSFTFSPCLVVDYPDKPETIDTKLHVTVTLMHYNATIEGADKKGVFVFNPLPTLSTRNLRFCQPLKVILPKNGDYDQDLVFNMSASLVQDPLTLTKFNPGLVLMNDTTSLSAVFTAPQLPGSNLTFENSTTLIDNYVIGSSENETLMLRLHNSGNTASGACVRVRVRGVSVSSVGAGRGCSLSRDLLRCTPQPPLKRGGSWTVNATLSTKLLDSSVEKIEIFTELLRHCTHLIGAPYEYTFALKSDPNITIWSPGIVSVNATKKELASPEGKLIEHNYMIINNGKTKWVQTKCEVTFPSNVTTHAVLAGNNGCKIHGNKAICIIRELRKDVPAYVRVQMEVHKDDPIAEKIKSSNEKIKTHLVLILNSSTTIVSDLTTVLALWNDPQVPLWIMIVAALVGLVILLILGWILHECGCLKRKSKEKLQALKQDIRRQTVRRSMHLRQSMIEVIKNEQGNEDQQRLVDVAEESESSADAVSHEDTKDAIGSKKREGKERGPFAVELDKVLKKTDTKTHTKAHVHADSN